MKKCIILLIICLVYLSAFSQNNFEMGLKYSQEGNFNLADSFFISHLNHFPNDRNARFNHGMMRLSLGDTCSFCLEMNKLCNSGMDKAACDYYNKFCGSYDTVYFDKSYVRCKKEKARYTEIIENFLFNDFKTVYVHDKKFKNGSFYYNPEVHGITESKLTDIIAVYRLYKDNSKVFLFSVDQPLFPGGDDEKRAYFKKNIYFKEAMEKLDLKKLVVSIEYLIDKYGYVRNVKLIGTRPQFNNTIELEKYITKIMLGIPKFSPAKFFEENVSYLVSDYISFW